MKNRSVQISEAQNRYREKRKNEGFARLQTWLSADTKKNLNHLSKKLNLTNADVIAEALKKFNEQEKT